MASQHPAPTIGDLINMTDTDTTEADDAIEQSDHRPIPPDAAFAIAFNLIALAADPRAFKKKLQGLHRALTAVDEGMARLAADRAAHDALVTKTTAELAEREKKLRAREVEHFAERGRFEETRKILRERHPCGNIIRTMMVGPRRRARACRGLSPSGALSAEALGTVPIFRLEQP
jgi:hypothetical protein